MVNKVNLKHLREIIASEKTVIVDFYATWCGECKMTEDSFLTISDEYKGIKFLIVDVDEEKLWKTENNEFAIKNVPTFMVIHNGKEIGRIFNFQPESKIREFISKSLESIKNE